MKPGAPAAIWIWREGRDVWKLRTTTSGQMIIFQGAVAGTTGPIVGVRANRNELTDRVELYQQRVMFRFITEGDFDGFDFVTENDACVQFYIPLDSKMSVDRIFFGARQIQPKSNRILACP